MLHNYFNTPNAKVYTQNGFIPCGKEYTILCNTINNIVDRKGSFIMVFTNNDKPGFTSLELKVNYVKL